MWIRYLLTALLAFGAINAFAGGYYGLSGAPGVPVEWLASRPFKDYFIPSLILMLVVGGAFSFAAVALFARSRLARVGAFAAGIDAHRRWDAENPAGSGDFQRMDRPKLPRPLAICGSAFGSGYAWFLTRGLRELRLVAQRNGHERLGHTARDVFVLPHTTDAVGARDCGRKNAHAPRR